MSVAMAKAPCTAILAVLVLGGTAAAEIRTTKLPVTMTCPMSDPPVLEHLLLQVSGIHSVDISFDEQSVIVTYDDAEASLSDFTAALGEFNVREITDSNGPPQAGAVDNKADLDDM